MTRAIPHIELIDACEASIREAESRYSRWSGTTVRSAPESLVQVILAEHLFDAGARVRLEVSVRSLIQDATGAPPSTVPRNNNGRIDVVAYFDSGAPRLLIEVKKANGLTSVDRDHERIQQILSLCPKIHFGILVVYGTAVNAKTIETRVAQAKRLSRTKLLRLLDSTPVIGKSGKPRILAGAIFRVDRAQ